MADWEKLAEARIQEWLARPAPAAPRDTAGSAAPLEVQLLEEARDLYEQARSCADAAGARAMRERAATIETRIMVLLEESGRPLAAQRFAQMLAEVRQGAKSPER